MPKATEPAKITKSLTTRATDNFGQTYEVSMEIGGWIPGTYHNPATGQCDLKKPSTKWVLRIHATPGQWHIDELLRKPTCSIYLDFGQNWVCTNFDAILAEASTLI